jgi:sterol desaturase/sphingolipid hydroxylase (fatty acid hydroxylase superfamily)
MWLVNAVLSTAGVFVTDLWGSLPVVGLLALVYTVLGLLPPCNAGLPWWRKPDLATDIGYAVVMPGVVHYGRIFLLMTGMVLIYGITDPAAASAAVDHGIGPFASWPFALQIVVYLFVSDLLSYFTHRWFHDIRLWRYHAVHHSSEHLHWTSSFRFHPVDFISHVVFSDCLLLLLGIPPAVLIFLAPFSIAITTLAHANLDWDFGPFRVVLASPVYHRWHHTGVDEGGASNFAGTFPVFDLIFGTYYMPKGKRPSRYGVTERDVPADFIGQLRHPFRTVNPAPARPSL